MSQCPKCSCLSMIGPIYKTAEQLGDRIASTFEFLVYRCGQCGYEERKPCDDSKTKLSYQLSKPKEPNE